jgi:hypothetical protein
MSARESVKAKHFCLCGSDDAGTRVNGLRWIKKTISSEPALSRSSLIPL